MLDPTGATSELRYTFGANGWADSTQYVAHDLNELIGYTYTPLGRVHEVRQFDGGAWNALERFAFDDAGNMASLERFGGTPVSWTYDTPTRFGELEQRTSDLGEVEFGAFDSVGRLVKWEQPAIGGLQEFEYDGNGQLALVVSGEDLTSLYYDVDDQAVFELRSFEEIHRFEGARYSDGELFEVILPFARAVTNDAGETEIRVVMSDRNGGAAFVWDQHGNLVRREVNGAFGESLEIEFAQFGDDWVHDGLHKAERDRTNGISHFRTRHVRTEDGFWLQEEPMLRMAPTAIPFESPLQMSSRTYAAGNPLTGSDTTGNCLGCLIFWTTGAANAPTPTSKDEPGGMPIGRVAVGFAGGEFADQSDPFVHGGKLGSDVVAFTVGIVYPVVGVAHSMRSAAYDVSQGRTGIVFVGLGDFSFGATRALAQWATRNVAREVMESTACFVAGTEVRTVAGDTLIEEVRAGDVVLSVASNEPLAKRVVSSAASSDASEEAWVKVESDQDVRSAEWSPRGVCSRIARAGRKAVLPAMLAACDPASAAVELPIDVAVVQVYDARTGAWERGTVGDLEVGDEVLHDGHLLRVTDEGIEDRGFAEIGQLSEADATWTIDGVPSVPDGDDWVLVLGDNDDAGHWRLRDLAVGERFAFGGRVFESDVVDGELAVRATEQVLSRVVQTIVRQSDTVIDAEIAYKDGTVEVITGTPEHPFWVPKLREWVPLGELVEGTELHVDSGAGAILVSSTWRQGDLTVYNFEVEGTHNYFVRAPGSDAPAVLVHNSIDCFDALRDAANAVAKSDKGGRLTEAGRALAKHGSPRKSNNFSPHPRFGGIDDLHDVDKLNAWGAELVDEMMGSTDAVWTKLSRGGREVRLPDGTGARWNADGSFSGFVDPLLP